MLIFWSLIHSQTSLCRHSEECCSVNSINISRIWTSLVVQWLRICLPMQGTEVRSLVWDNSTCCKATRPVRHNSWAQIPQLLKLTSPRAYALQQEKPPQQEAQAPQWRPSTTKNKQKTSHIGRVCILSWLQLSNLRATKAILFGGPTNCQVPYKRKGST